MTMLLLLALAFATGPEAPTPATEPEVVEEAPPGEAAADVEEMEAPEEPAWTPKYPGEPSPDWKHYDLEELYAAKKFDAGLKATLAKIQADPNDADLYWLAGRFMFEQGELFGDDKNIDKEAHYAEMVRLAEVGLSLRPNDPHLRFAHGIGNGRLGTTRGVLATLWLASSVEADWLSAANSGFVYSSIDGSERMPCDVHQGLGIYYRLVPDAWIVKVIAGTRGSLELSLRHLETANSCSPGRQHIQKELGVTQLCIGTKKKDEAMLAAGKAILEKAASHPETSEKAKIDNRHARMLIADPSMACGYSRDGQQDVDAEKLNK